MKHRLFLIALAALAPLIALAAGLSFVSFRQQQAALRAEAAHYVRDALREVDLDLLGQIEILKALASSPALDGSAPDLETFRRQAAQLRQDLKRWDVIILADLEGRQVVNTRVPAGEPLPRVVDPETFRTVVATQAPLIGNASGPGPSATDGIPRASIRVPVIRDGAIRYVLTGVASPERLSGFGHGLEAGWRAFLLDGAGLIVAATRREIIGRRPSEQTLAARAASREGVYDGVTLDGVPTVAAFRTSERIGWSAHVVIPQTDYNAPLRRSFWYIAACLVAAIGLTLILIEYLRREARDQERAAAQLKEAEARYRLLAENATDMIIRTGLDGVRRYISSACRDILGFGPEEYVGARMVDIAHPDDVAAVASGLEALASGRIEQETITYRAPHRDGHWVWLEARRRLVRDSEGKPDEIVSVVRDISERVRLEEQFRQAQKMEAVGQLTGGVAHDFNNLLTVILGNAELLTEYPDLPPAMAALARQIEEAAERGSELNQKLLAFGRRQSLKPERLKLGQVIDGMMPLLNRTLGEHIHLRMEPGSESLSALTDRTLLESAILNLAVNARDAMPRGGTLTIATGERSAGPGEGALPVGQPVVFVRVSDTGTGMAPEVLAHVFEPFFTTKEVGKGSGLGLPMVFGFAQQSAGHVAIESEVGRGTAVTIVLPAIAGELDARSAEVARAPVPATARARILVVEDEPQVLQLVASQLLGLGYEVTAVSTARDALGLLEEAGPFDVLFTDVVLPQGMSGVELAREACRLYPSLKVLLTSGYSEEAFEQYGRPNEGTLVLRKPYRRAELAEMLRQVLDGPAPEPPRE